MVQLCQKEWMNGTTLLDVVNTWPLGPHRSGDVAAHGAGKMIGPKGDLTAMVALLCITRVIWMVEQWDGFPCFPWLIHGTGILTYSCLIFMANVGKYTIHGSDGFSIKHISICDSKNRCDRIFSAHKVIWMGRQTNKKINWNNPKIAE